MCVIPPGRCVKCIFEPGSNRSSNFPLNNTQVFYGITNDLLLHFHDLKSYISQDERIRAARFYNKEDSDTFIACHALLRLILSKTLKKNPSEIYFNYDKNKKPGLAGDPLFFIISHVRGSFAIVISKYYYAGIDMEKVDKEIDFLSVVSKFFSEQEQKYILGSNNNALETFFLLWTRKEALLKAIGTGIVINLPQISIHDKVNIIFMKSFNNKVSESLFKEHYIYSIRVLNYYLSVALPQKEEIRLVQFNKESINSYLA
jgi:4'-phosphopantetheinyl transferase